MLEGKALVVAIMMLTAAPLVVTDDGRAIVGDVTRDVTDIFADSEPLPAEDPKLDEVLDDAKDKTKEKDSELDRKDVSSKETKEEKSCYYLEEIKEEMMEGKEGRDKEVEWETEEELFELLENLAADCEEGDEESCEKLSDLRQKIGDEESEEREEESEERSRSSSNESNDEGKEESKEKEIDEELMAQMEELKSACEEGNEESCEELRSMLSELMEDKKDWDKEDKDWDKEGKDWDEECLTMEEWEEAFKKDKKVKDGKHKDNYKEERREMTVEDMMEMFAELDEEELSSIKQITNMSDDEWDQMIVKLETDNMSEEDWKMVMEKMELIFEHERKEERAEMEAFRTQMREFEEACEAGNETACDEFEAMMAEIEEDFREDKEGCEEREEDESEEEESEEESNEEEDLE